MTEKTLQVSVSSESPMGTIFHHHSIYLPSDCSCFYLFFFNFSILFYFLNLQYCIGFAIYQHESATGIHVLLIYILETGKLPLE